MRHLLIFGGTFDPVHLGHLKTAQYIQRMGRFDAFYFVPCQSPVLKPNAIAKGKHRKAMLELALQDYPEFSIDSRELNRKTPSYMVETLLDYRKEYGEDVSLTLLLGLDAFMHFEQWHQYQDILNLTHIILMHREGYDFEQLSANLKALLKQHEITSIDDLKSQPAGFIYRCHAGDYPMTSRDIRQRFKAGDPVEALLPKGVLDYILSKQVYPELSQPSHMT